ncbi:MAG: hypothetical protein AAGG01_13695, partial [Planctomycetota bacterium]
MRNAHLVVGAVLFSSAFAQVPDRLGDAVMAPFGPTIQDPAADSLQVNSSPRDAEAPEGAPLRRPIERRRVYVTPHGDGTWIRGRTYKARVSEAGFRYVPFLGASAERNWPLDLRLRSATAGQEPLSLTDAGTVTRDGLAFEIDRGDVTVRYDASVDSIEQTFVVHSGPVLDGDVQLELDLTTDLVVEEAPEGWRFSTARGGVQVSEAIALDGTRVLGTLPMEFSGGTMRVTVPARMAQAVTDELIIDPVFYTFVVDDFDTEERRPDLAYARLRDQYTYVWEDYFSASDIDIFHASYEVGGAQLSIGYVDSGDRNWLYPKIASRRAHDQWLVVAEREGTGGLGNEVVGRQLSGAAMSIGIEVVFGEATSGWTNHRPEVGGSWSTDASSRYLVVWERQFATERQIRFRLMDGNNSLSLVSSAGSLPNGVHTAVRVSPSTGDPQSVNRWNVACIREVLGSGENRSVAGFQVNGSGTVPFGQSLRTLESGYPFVLDMLDVSDSIAGPDGLDSYVIYAPRRSQGRFRATGLVCRNQTVLRRYVTSGFHGGFQFPAGNDLRVAATRGRFIFLDSVQGLSPGSIRYSEWDLLEEARLGEVRRREDIVGPVGFGGVEDPPAIASRWSGGQSSEVCGIVWSSTRSDGTATSVLGAYTLSDTNEGFGRPLQC